MAILFRLNVAIHAAGRVAGPGERELIEDLLLLELGHKAAKGNMTPPLLIEQPLDEQGVGAPKPKCVSAASKADGLDRAERGQRWARRYHRGWRAPLPRRKSTNPPANSCGREVILPIWNCSRN
jgi:hypothetical protein